MTKERVKKADRVAQGCNCAYSNGKHAKYCWFKEQTNSWEKDYYNLYEEGRIKENAPQNYIDFFKSRNFISKIISQEREKWIKSLEELEAPMEDEEGRELTSDLADELETYHEGFFRAINLSINLIQK
jgi:hypothetical protein